MFDENENKVAPDGMYKMLTLTGRWLSQFQIRSGKLFSYGQVEQKNKESKNTQKTSACTDWYLITTYYYTDGTTEETKEYLGTTCGDCVSTDQYAYFCQNPDGGGGDNASDPDPNQLDDIVSVQEEISKSASSNVDLVSGPNPDGTSMFWTWEANVSYIYSRTTKIIDRSSVNATKPFAVPSSNLVVDYNGQLWTVYHWAETWSFQIQWINLSAFTVIFDFATKEVWDPGSRGPYTGREIMTKTCVAL